MRMSHGVGLLLACASCGGVGTPSVIIPDGPPAAAMSSVAPPPRLPPLHAVAPIVWERTERDAAERAKRLKLPLLVWVRAEWSASSLEMERTTWRDPKVADAARPFVALSLDLTEPIGPVVELYSERYGANAIPLTLVFDASGHRTADLYGFQTADKVAAALRDGAAE